MIAVLKTLKVMNFLSSRLEKTYCMSSLIWKIIVKENQWKIRETRDKVTSHLVAVLQLVLV